MSLYYANSQLFEVAVGVFVPLIVLAVMEFGAKTVDPGFKEIQEKLNSKQAISNSEEDHQLAIFPARLLGFSIGVLAVIMFGLMLFTTDSSRTLIGVFSAVLFILSTIILLSLKVKKSKKIISTNSI